VTLAALLALYKLLPLVTVPVAWAMICEERVLGLEVVWRLLEVEQGSASAFVASPLRVQALILSPASARVQPVGLQQVLMVV
jgi:hypothetical protein